MTPFDKLREHLIELVTGAMECAVIAKRELRLGNEDDGLLRCGHGYWAPDKALWMNGGDSEGQEVAVEVAVDRFLKAYHLTKVSG